MLNTWFINRQGNVVNYELVRDYEIKSDYLTGDLSKFVVTQYQTIKKGMFVISKYASQGNVAFFGVVKSVDNSTINCGEIFTTADFEITTTSKSGNSFEAHAISLINKYLINDPSKEANIIEITKLTDTPHVYQPSDPPTARSLTSYLINGFKKYNIVWKFVEWDGKKIKTTIERIDRSLQIKDNGNSFANWEYYSSSMADVNKLLIVDKATNDMENIGLFATYYLTSDNEITTNWQDARVIKPTQEKVFFYDNAAEDKPSYIDVANSELKGNVYSHEIEFDLYRDSTLIDFENLEIGTLFNIYRGSELFQSVLTGYSFSSGSSFVHLTFGNIRSRLSEILE